MANRPGQKIKMTSIDELLCVPSTEGTTDIEVEAIYPFENHPFKVLDDEKMDELVESIKANGILAYMWKTYDSRQVQFTTVAICMCVVGLFNYFSCSMNKVAA